MRSLLAVAMIGAGAVLLAPTAPAHAMSAGAAAGFAKVAPTADPAVEQVHRKWRRGHRHYRHRHFGHRHYRHRHHYRPYYYGGYSPYYYRPYRYHKRPRFGLYFGF